MHVLEKIVSKIVAGFGAGGPPYSVMNRAGRVRGRGRGGAAATAAALPPPQSELRDGIWSVL